jgi:hypothetical protein
MFNSLNRQRVQWILFLSGIALVGYYFLVYRPLSRTLAALDQPLSNLWQQLVLTNQETKKIETINLNDASETLRRIQQAKRKWTGSRDEVLRRIALDPATQSKINQPFQLLDFENERQLRVEELKQLAKQHQVLLDPSVPDAYPRYNPVTSEPATLWADLAVVHHTLALAAQNKVPTINSARVLPFQAQRPSGSGAGVQEFRVQIELIGPMSAISRFLVSLPEPAESLKATVLPQALPGKPALFLEKWILRKNSAEKPDEVRLNAVVCGFVHREVSNGHGAQYSAFPSANRPAAATEANSWLMDVLTKIL